MSPSIRILKFLLTSKVKKYQKDNRKMTGRIVPIGILLACNKKKIMVPSVSMMQLLLIH